MLLWTQIKKQNIFVVAPVKGYIRHTLEQIKTSKSVPKPNLFTQQFYFLAWHNSFQKVLKLLEFETIFEQ